MGKGISIITPCYNDGRYLREAVESIYAQKTSLTLDPIIIDDGSTDPATLAEIKALQNEFHGLRVFYQKENLGVSAARNIGVKHALYPHVMALDADDKISTHPVVVEKDYLARSVDVLERNPCVKFVYAKMKFFETLNHVYATQTPYNEKKILCSNMVGAWGIFRRDDILKVGGYKNDLRYGEDWELSIALLNEAVKEGKAPDVHFIDDVLYCYRRRADKSSVTQNVKIKIEDVILKIAAYNPEIYDKHFPELQGKALTEAILPVRNSILAEKARQLFTHCAAEPFTSLRDGSWQLAAYDGMRGLQRVMHHVVPHRPEPQN